MNHLGNPQGKYVDAPIFFAAIVICGESFGYGV